MALRTRTLAGLYLAQGHPAKALDMIERLLAERPGDAQLVRLRAEAGRQLEQGPVGFPVQAEARPEDDSEAPCGVSEQAFADVLRVLPPVTQQRAENGGAVARGRADAPGGDAKPKATDRALAFFIERTSRLITAVMERRRR